MRINIVHHDSCKVVILPETVTVSSSAAALRKTLFSLYEHGHNNIILDFGKVKLLDCAGLGTILFSQNRLKKRGGEIRIVNVESKHLKNLFELIHIHSVIKIEQ